MTIVATAWLDPDEVVASRFDPAEHALAVRAQYGDRAAQRELYELYAPRVKRFIVDMLRDRDTASDALQDTFVRVFQRMSTLENPSRFVGWMFGIARRVCLEERRRTARLTSRLTSRAGRDTERSEESLEVAHHDPSPEAALSFAQSAALLERALEKLTPDRRAVLLMRCDHLLSYDEIATAMGFSLAKVKVEIFRARASLRSALSEEISP